MRRLGERLRESSRALAGVAANPALRRLELAFAASIVGSWAFGIAVLVYAYAHGGSAAVGLVGVLRWVVPGVISPFSAVLGDRYERRLVMIASDLARAGLISAAAAAAFLRAAPAVVYVLTGLMAIAGTAFRPAEAAYTPALARTPDELTAANVVAGTIESLGIFAGPAVGGVLLAATNTGTVFLAAAGMIIFSAAQIARIRPFGEPEPAPRSGASPSDEVLAGVREIARQPRLKLLVGLLSAQSFVDGLLNVLIVVVALKVLAGGAATVGYLNSAIGIGGLAGALLAAASIGRGRLAGDLGVGVALFGLPIALLAAWTNRPFALALLVLVGVGNTLLDVSGMTLLQRAAPDAVLARVFGVLESLLLLAVGLGAILAAPLISAAGTRGALVATGAVLPVLVVLAWRGLTAIDRSAEVPVQRLERLRAVPIFAPLPERTLEQLAGQLQERRVEPGREIVRQGEAGDRFYIIDSGALDVLVDGELRTTLGPGDVFGEIALLRDVPRTATVRVRVPSVLFSLGRAEFVPAVTGSAASLASAHAVIGTRLGAPPR